MIRTASSFAQVTVPLAGWLAKNGARRATTLVSEYNPGIDAENAARAKRPAELFQATLGAIKRSLQGKGRTR